MGMAWPGSSCCPEINQAPNTYQITKQVLNQQDHSELHKFLEMPTSLDLHSSIMIRQIRLSYIF